MYHADLIRHISFTNTYIIHQIILETLLICISNIYHILVYGLFLLITIITYPFLKRIYGCGYLSNLER